MCAVQQCHATGQHEAGLEQVHRRVNRLLQQQHTLQHQQSSNPLTSPLANRQRPAAPSLHYGHLLEVHPPTQTYMHTTTRGQGTAIHNRTCDSQVDWLYVPMLICPPLVPVWMVQVCQRMAACGLFSLTRNRYLPSWALSIKLDKLHANDVARGLKKAVDSQDKDHAHKTGKDIAFQAIPADILAAI